MNRIYNFGAGPATLPVSVLKSTSLAVQEIASSGMSLLEISHRSKTYETIHHQAQSRLLSLLGLNSDQYAVLFLGGGASLQFCMLPMNFLTSEQSADYVHTGEWSGRAIQEAKRWGRIRVVSNSESKNFNYIDRNLNLNSGSRYLHITTNNTIEGTQWLETPDSEGLPLVADASSDLLGIKRDHSQFALIYAGAQKNLGPAGVTVVVIRKSFLAQAKDDMATWLSYKTHDKADSLYNTPPVAVIFVLNEVLGWIQEQGGVAALDVVNRKKAALIYSALQEFPDRYETAVPDSADRSIMNITFRLKDPSRETSFLALAQSLKMDGLKGHRSVGGFRASIYNAFPIEGCEKLAQLIRQFART